ncbi:MAG TPA: carbonic anhydrase family protein [Pyrinomonadaceae bacterium]|jgi:carbonic anhydrase
MSKIKAMLLLLVTAALFSGLSIAVVSQNQAPKKSKQEKRLTQTKESQAALNPAEALKLLKEGNLRFVAGRTINRDLRAQVKETSEGQYPYAVILSCQDSRTSSDLLFDLNKGDAFSLRIAGNVVNEDILGGMEFGTKVAGAKLIAVIGHTKCGAIYGACDDVKMGNLTGLLDRIKPAIKDVSETIQPRDSKNPAFVNAVTEQNVRYQMRMVREKSPILREMIDKGEVGLVGGIYDISTGKVEFFEK